MKTCQGTLVAIFARVIFFNLWDGQICALGNGIREMDSAKRRPRRWGMLFGQWIPQGLEDPGSRILDLGSRIHDPGPWIQDLGSRIQDP